MWITLRLMRMIMKLMNLADQTNDDNDQTFDDPLLPRGESIVLGEWHRGIVGEVVCKGGVTHQL